jgi:hypothetical protein
LTTAPDYRRCQRASVPLSRRELLARSAAFAGGLLAAGGLRAADLPTQEETTGDRLRARRLRPRVIVNDDGFNFLYSCDDLGAEDLRAYLSRLRNTHVDMVSYSVAEGGYVTLYQSEVADPIGRGFEHSSDIRLRRLIQNRQRLRREVGDYIGFVFKTLRELGLPVLASFRMNDAHMASDPTGPLAGSFWKKHPEWRLGDPYGYYAVCLDYAQPAVREYLRQVVHEVITKFPDVDGVELDGMRSPFFFKAGAQRKNAPLLTELIRQVRGDLDQAAKARGRDRYLLRVNVPRIPEAAMEAGMDVAAWDAEKLVDGISPGCYNTDFQPACERWKNLVRDRMLIHAYISCGAGPAIYNSLEQYRAAAANAYGAGADGVYLFNYPCLDELSRLLPTPVEQAPMPPPAFHAQCWHSDINKSREALGELGDPAGLARKDKHYLFYVPNPAYPHYTPEHAVIDRRQPQPAELVFRCYHAANAKTLRLQVKAVNVTTSDEFSLSLNGRAIDGARIRRLHAPGGRDVRIHSIPLQAYSQYVVALAPDMLQRGENRLAISLRKGDPGLVGSIELVELELFLHY